MGSDNTSTMYFLIGGIDRNANTAIFIQAVTTQETVYLSNTTDISSYLALKFGVDRANAPVKFQNLGKTVGFTDFYNYDKHNLHLDNAPSWNGMYCAKYDGFNFILERVG